MSLNFPSLRMCLLSRREWNSCSKRGVCSCLNMPSSSPRSEETAPTETLMLSRRNSWWVTIATGITWQYHSYITQLYAHVIIMWLRSLIHPLYAYDHVTPCMLMWLSCDFPHLFIHCMHMIMWHPLVRTQLSEISMAQDMDSLRRNIIIYDMFRGTKFILRASKTSVRDHWLSQSADLIQEAKIKVANMLSRQRSDSDPNEYLSRSPSLSLQRSMIRKDREKRNHLRPNSSTGFRMSLSPSPEEQVCEELVD